MRALLAIVALAIPSVVRGLPAPVDAGLEGAYLNDAPVRLESQDTTGWRPRLKAGKTRAEVVNLYQNVYVPGSGVALNWTGAIAGCVPGTTSAAHQQAVIARINYFRALTDLPPVTVLDGTQLTNSQAAALIMSANNDLDHSPPSSWNCYSSAGYAGAGSANLALGVYGVTAIDMYMSDPGGGNGAVGHRRWILFPPRASMATGDVPQTGSQWPANALHVFGPTTTRPATPNGVAWPPAGFVPYPNLPSESNRWSFSYPSANFSNASVTMTGPGGSIPVQLEPVANGYGDNTLVFKPTGFPYGNPGADKDYVITVTGITGTGVPSTIQYTVTVINPAGTTYELELVAGAGGSIGASPSQASYASGSVVTLTAVPKGDYVFTGWSGDLVGNANPAQITMNADRTVGAGFAPILVPTATAPGGSTGMAPGAAGSVVVVPLVARTGSFATEVFVSNPSASAVDVDIRLHGARGTSAAGLNDCGTRSIPAGETLRIALAEPDGCPGLPAGSQFGMLVLEEVLLRTPLTAYSRTANPQGNGFSVEGYPIGEFSAAAATVTGLKRILGGPPPYQTNCFVGALGEPVSYQIVLTQGQNGQPVGTPLSGTLQPWETVRYLDVFGPGGANAPSPEYNGVRADFAVTGNSRPALIGYCTVQDSFSFGADFRMAKGVDGLDDSQRRTVHVGHDGSGVLAGPSVIEDVTRRHVYLSAVRHPDTLACSLVGPRSGDLEIRLREPGTVGSAPVRAGGNNAAGFGLDIGGPASVHEGVAGYWTIEVGFREGANASVPIAYGLTCRAGGGMSLPLLVNPVGFADDY